MMIVRRIGHDGIWEFVCRREKGIEEPTWSWTVLMGTAYDFEQQETAEQYAKLKLGAEAMEFGTPGGTVG